MALRLSSMFEVVELRGAPGLTPMLRECDRLAGLADVKVIVSASGRGDCEW